MLRKLLEHRTSWNIPKNQEALITTSNQDLLMDWVCSQDKSVFWQSNLRLASEVIVECMFDCVPHFDATLVGLQIVKVTWDCCDSVAASYRPSHCIRHRFTNPERHLSGILRKHFFLNVFNLLVAEWICKLNFFCFAATPTLIDGQQESWFIVQVKLFLALWSPLVHIQVPQIDRAIYAASHQYFAKVGLTLLRR